MMFGLSFFNPSLLWGLSAAAIPILVHLFNRRRFRTVAWAAMDFLISSNKLTSRRLKIFQALLLLTRMGIVSLLVVGVARPYLMGDLFGGVLARSKSSAVIILDNSYSMGLRDGNETVFDAARRVASAVVSSFRRGDSLTCLLMASRPRIVTQGNPSPESVKRLIEKSEPSDEGTDVLAALVTGLEILQSEKNTRKELLLITDCQRIGWRAGNKAGWEKVAGLLSQATVKPRMYVIDVSRQPGENVTVDSVRLPAYPCGVGKKYMVEASARSPAARARGRPIFTLFLDDGKREVARAEGSEFRDGVSTARLILSVDSPGSHWGKVEIQPDSLNADNERYFTFEARRSVPILCVDGAAAPDRFESGIAYLTYAFAPEKGMEVAEGVSNVLDPKVVTVEQFVSEDLGQYAIVVLANVRSISERMYENLENFVANGGGLMVLLGDKVDAAEYSERYASSTGSFLPCRVGPAKGELAPAEGKEEGKEVYRISKSEMDSSHPAMAAFKDGAGGDLSTAKFHRFFTVQPDAADTDARVLARFTDGSPCLIEKRFGQGRTVLFTSSCDLKWTNLPLKPAFVPLMHRLAYYLVSGVDERFNLTVGEKIVQGLRAEAASRPATMTNPLGESFKVIAAKGDAGEDEAKTEPFITFEQTSGAGIYTLSISEAPGKGNAEGKEEVKYFAVNVDTEESDISVVEEGAVRGLIGAKELTYLKGDEAAVRAIERIRHGREIWRFFLIGVFLFLVVESVLARHIDKG